MHKTNEGFQVQTALERAEKRLEEAIELAKQKNNIKESESNSANKAVEDAMSEFKKVARQEHRDLDSNTSLAGTQLYGYGPELSCNRKIESDVKEIDDDKKALLESILGESEEKLAINQKLLNEEFHDGYDALNEIGNFNKALKLRNKQSPEASILSDSEEYEMKCFNEKNVFDGGTCEPQDIMPCNFYFHSFDEEDEEKVKPYDINGALLLGDPISPNSIPEELENTLVNSDVSSEQEDEDLDLKKQELIQQIQQQAEDTLEKSRVEAQKIIDDAQQESKRIIDEKVQEAMDEASKKGFDEGYKKGENEGFLAAENAVNEGMIQEAEAFRNELKLQIQEFEERKNEILDNNLNELTDLAINVAEKVIQISLKSSKDVVAKMIVAAAEECRNKEWAKVYISHEDKVIAMNLEKGLIDVLKQMSANVKVVVMEDEPSGTCIIETPDQRVDASVGSQLDNIRQIVSDNKM